MVEVKGFNPEKFGKSKEIGAEAVPEPPQEREPSKNDQKDYVFIEREIETLYCRLNRLNEVYNESQNKLALWVGGVVHRRARSEEYEGLEKDLQDIFRDLEKNPEAPKELASAVRDFLLELRIFNRGGRTVKNKEVAGFTRDLGFQESQESTNEEE